MGKLEVIIPTSWALQSLKDIITSQTTWSILCGQIYRLAAAIHGKKCIIELSYKYVQ